MKSILPANLNDENEESILSSYDPWLVSFNDCIPKNEIPYFFFSLYILYQMCDLLFYFIRDGKFYNNQRNNIDIC